MGKRFVKCLMVVLSMVPAIMAVRIMEQTPTGLNTDNDGLWLSMVKMLSLFVPPFILSFFHHVYVGIFSAVYQGIFIFLMFLMMIFIGMIAPHGGFWIWVMGIVGAILSICSMIITIIVKEKQEGY